MIIKDVARVSTLIATVVTLRVVTGKIIDTVFDALYSDSDE